MKPIILTIFLLALVGCGKTNTVPPAQDDLSKQVNYLKQVERELVQMNKITDVIGEALAENHRRNQTNRPPVPGETTHGTLEIYATHSQTNYFKEVPKWGSVALCEPTNQPPVIKIDEGTLLAHAYSDSYVAFWYGDDKQDVGVLQIGASPNGLTVSRLSTNNLWQLTNIVIETRCEPVVIGYETHWQITFKEAK